MRTIQSTGNLYKRVFSCARHVFDKLPAISIETQDLVGAQRRNELYSDDGFIDL